MFNPQIFLLSNITRFSQGISVKRTDSYFPASTDTIQTVGNILSNAILLQFLWGCSYGCYIFLYGAWFTRQLGRGDFIKGAVLASVLLAARQALNAVLDIPFGILADRFGRLNLVKFAFIAKLMFHGTLASLAFISLRSPMILGMVSSIFFSLAYTGFSGAFSAWVVDESQHSQVDPLPVLAAGHNAFFLGELLTGIISVLLFFWKPPAGFLLGAGFCAVGTFWTIFRCTEYRTWATARPAKLDGKSRITGKFNQRFHALAIVFSQGRIVLMVMMSYGCFMFLLNFVEHYWPALLDARKQGIGSLNLEQVWMIAVFIVCVSRLAGARLFKNHLNVMKTIPIEVKVRRVRPLFLVCGLSAAVIALITGFFTHITRGAEPLFASLIVVPILVFLHGLLAPLYDVLVNAIIPTELAPNRAAVLSVGTTVRSILVTIFVVPSAKAFADRWDWALPGGILLIASLGAMAFMKGRILHEKSLIQ